MGTTQKTDQQGQFNQAGMGAYNQMMPAFGNAASQYIQSPFSNPFFQTQQQLGTRQAQNLGGTQMNNLIGNMTAGGMAGGQSSPAGLEMMQNQARANTGLQANLGFLNPVQNALSMQQNAMGMASQFRPLQTGQQTTQSTSGTGTWLPQVLNAGMGIAGAAMGMPGMGSMFGGGGQGGGLSSFGPGNWAGGVPGNFGFGGGLSGLSGMGGLPNYGGNVGAPAIGGGMGTPPPPLPGQG